jgi:hypothetical protein
MLQETFCYGDVLLRRRFVWRRFVEETFCAETFCMCARKSILKNNTETATAYLCSQKPNIEHKSDEKLNH